MDKLKKYYDFSLPLNSVKYLRSCNYDPEDFLNWYLSNPQIDTNDKKYKKPLAKKDLALVFFAYYFWVFYVVSALVIFSINALVSIGAIILSPFLVGGIIYGVAYLVERIKNFRSSKK